MDGKFFFFFSKGESNNHLFYHVKYSIIKQNVSKEFNKDWLKIKKNNKKIIDLKKKMYLDFKKFLLAGTLKNKFFIDILVPFV